MASSLIPGCHVMSDLLTMREKGILVGLLEPQCKDMEKLGFDCNLTMDEVDFPLLIKTTVAQILQAKDTQGESPSWSCLGCGVVCLVEDESVCSHFLRVYCVKRAKLLWEQELYIPFKYTAARTYFHTFLADDHQAGLNFANEIEAEEFHLTVEAVHEKMISSIELTNTETAGSSASDLPDSGIEQVDTLDEEKHISMDASSTTAPVNTSSFKDLDPSMRRLLIQARITEEDLKDKDIAEAVDFIINQFGGLKAVQRELRNRGPVSQTLPRAAGASISLALKKGPLPPVPSNTDSTAPQQTPQCTDQNQAGTWIPSLPPAPATERIRKSASFKHVGSSTVAERGDQILTALRAVLRQKQQSTSEGRSQLVPDTNNDEKPRDAGTHL